MPLWLAQIVADVAGLYAGTGLVFAGAFVVRGVGRVDPVAAGARWGFRLLIIPGTVALWPVLLGMWWRVPRTGAAVGAHP